jgi:hypothetical protein
MMSNSMLNDVAVLTSLDEPFLSLAQTVCAQLGALDVQAEPVLVETFCLNPHPSMRSVYVMSNSLAAWTLASSLIRLGVRLLNGEAQVCDMDRRRWKSDLSAFGASTPQWASATTPAALMANWDIGNFPAYVKRADHGRGYVKRVASQGYLSEYFQLECETNRGPWLVERAVGDEVSHKSYVAGDPSNAFFLRNSEIVLDSPEVMSIASVIGDSTGLRMFSFDYVLDDAGIPAVIDVNRFPVYEDNHECWAMVAQHICSQVEAAAFR